MKFIRIIPLFVMLAGCSITPPTDPNYYLLKSADIQEATINSAQTISVMAVTVPEYLNRPQIITRSNETANLTIHEFDRWGENVADGISRVLSDNLMRNGVKSIPAKLGIPADLKLFVGIRRFEGVLNNQAELEAVWSVYSDTKDYPPQRTYYSVPSGQSIKELVEAQSLLLKKLAEDISAYVKNNIEPIKKKRK